VSVIRIDSAVTPDEPLDLAELERVLLAVHADHSEKGDVNLVLADDSSLRGLNREYRGIDSPTDVLSFDLRDGVHPPQMEIGEIYISVERAEVQAREAHRSFQEEVTHLAIHGLLHLFGYDHDAEPAGKRMRSREKRYLAGIEGVR
jgi:probable rRNA maturation factor